MSHSSTSGGAPAWWWQSGGVKVVVLYFYFTYTSYHIFKDIDLNSLTKKIIME